MKNHKFEKSFYVLLESSVILDKNLNRSAKILYAVICYCSNNDKGYALTSNKQLMELSDVSEKQFYRDIKTLREFNYIIVERTSKRDYIFPVINKIYLEAQKRRAERQNILSDLIDYDWLEDKD